VIFAMIFRHNPLAESGQTQSHIVEIALLK
jgi:hypothetical protein